MKEKKALTILLADDDEDDQMIFMDIVQQMDNDIILHTVNDGVELLELLTGKTQALPDLLFLDLNMPNKNGKECLREIKSHQDLRHLPVIIYSTSNAEKDIRDTYRYGASLYIQKPTDISGMKKTLTSVLSMDWQNGHLKINDDNFVVKTLAAFRHCFLNSPIHQRLSWLTSSSVSAPILVGFDI